MTLIKVFGQLSVERAGQSEIVAGRTLPLLLSIFASRANRTTSTETLVEELWPINAKRGRATLQVHINRLRELLGEGRPPTRLVTVPGGYRLNVAPDQLDSLDFEDRVGRARDALDLGNVLGAARALEESLATWDTPFGELSTNALLMGEYQRLYELRDRAEEDLCQAWLQLGRNDDAIERLVRLTDDEPLRERRWAQLMLALYRSGRQAEALRCFQRLRQTLGEELGVEPAPYLRRLEESILLHDPALVLVTRVGTIRPSNNLSPPVPVIGRDEQLAAVRELLDESRLVTILGPGGIGKTRFAMALAHRLLDELHDGVYAVSLDAVTSADDVAGAVVQSLGFMGESQTDIVRCLEVNLGSRNVVLILDGAEHVRDATAALAESLLKQCPQLSLVVTSQHALGVDTETVYLLGPLAVPKSEASLGEMAGSPAVRLFLARAPRAVDSEGTTLRDIGAICRALDGSPLAIELAAARTAALTPRDIRDRLDRQLPLLRDTRRDTGERHSSIEASLRRSLGIIDPEMREVLCRLGVFHGGFSIKAFDSVVAHEWKSDERVINFVESMVNRSLATVSEVGGETRFVLSASLAEFGRRHLAEQGVLDIYREAHREYYRALTFHASRTIVSNGLVVVPVLKFEHNNIRAALRFSIDRGETRRAIAIAAAMSIFWVLQGHVAEGRRWMADIWDMEPDLSPLSVARLCQASALLAAADLDYSAADGWFTEADAAYVEAGGGIALAWSRFWAGRMRSNQYWLGQGSRQCLDDGARQYEQALEHFRSVSDWAGIMSVLSYQTLTECLRGSDRAEGVASEMLRLARAVGSDRADASAYRAFSLVRLRNGEFKEAIAAAEIAGAEFGRNGDYLGEILSLCVISLGSLGCGDLDSARNAAYDALRLHRRYGTREYAMLLLALSWSVLRAMDSPVANQVRDALDVLNPQWPRTLTALGAWPDGSELVSTPEFDGQTQPPLRWPIWSPVFDVAAAELSIESSESNLRSPSGAR